MTLPYPYEIETDRLEPQQTPARDPLDIEQRVCGLVVPAGACVDIAGCRLHPPAEQSVRLVVDRVRGAIAKRLLQRRPDADESTWRKYTTSLQEAMCGRTELDEAALRQALLLIDGL